MKKILFIINTFKPIGGHYYSLITTVGALCKDYDVHIFNIGLVPSPIIEKSGFSYDFIFYNKRNFISVAQKVADYVKKEHVSIIHGFDSCSCYVSTYAIWRNKDVAFALTKCGGPLYKNRHIPSVKNIVVFSLQDLEYFERKHGGDFHVKCIPNRVYDFNSDEGRINGLREKYNLEGKRVVLRIGRISRQYIGTIKQSILLTKELHKFDSRFVLLIIGCVESDEFLQCIKNEHLTDYVYIESDSLYTSNAKEIIDVAEFVVGTGRNFMEACSKDKVMFVPCSEKKYPVLVSGANLKTAFYYNFSPRYTDEEQLTNINDLLIKINAYNIHSREWFEEYFSAEKILSLYTEFYKSLRCERLTLVQLLRSFINEYMYSFNGFISMYRRINKK